MTAWLLGKCPRCREGSVFKHPPFSIHFAAMNTQCPKCLASFEPEPGFYLGAMFVSYAFTVAIMFFVWLALYVTIRPSTSIYIYTFLACVVIATPFSFRYSRLAWLYWFGGHKRQS